MLTLPLSKLDIISKRLKSNYLIFSGDNPVDTHLITFSWLSSNSSELVLFEVTLLLVLLRFSSKDVFVVNSAASGLVAKFAHQQLCQDFF